MSTKAKEFDLQEWAQTRPELFDLTNEFNETVSPLMVALVAECHRLKIPVIINVGYKQDGIATGYATNSHFPSAQRTPVGMLYTKFAMTNDQQAMQSVLHANELRIIMSAITKH